MDSTRLTDIPLPSSGSREVAHRQRPVVVIAGMRHTDLTIEERRLRRFSPELRMGSADDPERLVELCGDADVVLASARPRFSAEVLSRLPSCKAIIRCGVGYDNVDLAAAAARGIQVGYVPDYCVEEVSDHALALALSLLRQLGTADALARTGKWGLVGLGRMAPFRSLVFGVVGLGRIGRALARKARGVGFTVIGHDPAAMPSDSRRWGVAELLPLDELVQRADVVSLHAALTAETYHLIDAQRLELMKTGAVLVNTARGGLVNEQALVDALCAGRLRGAGLDVLEAEPPRPESPLFQTPNLLITPHMAWYSEAAQNRVRELAAAEAGRVLNGRPMRHPVPAGRR